eukprot:jgi/Picre1/32205/NNA_007551.t1
MERNMARNLGTRMGLLRNQMKSLWIVEFGRKLRFLSNMQESVESSNFCELWEDAKKRHTTLQGQENFVKSNTLWKSIRKEAERDAEDEPLLSSFLYASILSHDSFERSLAFILANRLSNTTLLPTELFELFYVVLMRDEKIRVASQADLCAMRERDPACRSYSQALLYFKGFHAIQVQRIAHALWKQGRRVMAEALQSRSSEVFAVDIHPAAQIGKGVLLDHGTGVVIGETAVIGNNVSILQNVTLGGTGKQHGDRHPKVSDNVLIGASATILGNIDIGKGSQVAAGSLVLKPVPPKAMVAGSPAKVVGKVQGNPALNMEQWSISQESSAAKVGTSHGDIFDPFLQKVVKSGKKESSIQHQAMHVETNGGDATDEQHIAPTLIKEATKDSSKASSSGRTKSLEDESASLSKSHDPEDGGMDYVI